MGCKGPFPHHGFMQREAVPHEVWPGRNHSLQWRFYVVDVDVGDETVNGGIHAGRSGSGHIRAGGNEIVEGVEIGEAAGVGGVRRVAADALEMIALSVEVARLG